MGEEEYTSAKRLATEAKVLAYKQAQQPLPPVPPKPAGRPLLPIFVTIDRDNQAPIREQILWPIGDPDMTPETAAAKLCFELQVNPAAYATQVANAIRAGLACLDDCSGLIGPKVVRLQVYVRRGEWALFDDLDWDVAHPLNSAEAYATLACQQLGLGVGWYQAVTRHMAQQLLLVRQALRSRPDAVALQPRLAATARSEEEAAAAPLLPRIERYDAVREQQVQGVMRALVGSSAGKGQRSPNDAAGVKAEGGGSSGGGSRVKRE